MTEKVYKLEEKEINGIRNVHDEVDTPVITLIIGKQKVKCLCGYGVYRYLAKRKHRLPYEITYSKMHSFLTVSA